MSLAARLGCEVRAAFELWLVPLAVALLPYRAGIALARLVCQAPIFRQPTRDAARAYAAATGAAATRAWCNEYRFQQLIDRVDLYWTITRSRAFIDRLLRGGPAVPAAQGFLMVLSFHYGQGTWLMRWLAANGRPTQLMVARLVRAHCDSYLAYVYGRLRNRMVESLTGMPLIYTGAARAGIAAARAAGGTILGLVDVPFAAPGSRGANAKLLGHPVVFPTGLIKWGALPGTRALVVTARVTDDGAREIVGRELAIDSLTIGELAEELSTRLEHAPAAWHFWHLWPRFLAR